jgi:urease beta subunit
MAQQVAARAAVPIGAHFSDTSISSATSFDVPTSAGYVLISAETQAIRVRVEGGVATTSVGFKIPAGETWRIEVIPGSTISVIEVTASASVQGQFLSN